MIVLQTIAVAFAMFSADVYKRQVWVRCFSVPNTVVVGSRPRPRRVQGVPLSSPAGSQSCSPSI